ncbi:MAG: carotenoid biosynthesis protein [Candidatus Thorarchaeota archaeon]|nr:MAG: hypothetical protein DRO87_07745 [Candidatus Thorarchaeota archaeon]RLI57306.1 MAG: hypothetical protein DRP09_03415 [Candidatus Thorarchaeota archaeon]
MYAEIVTLTVIAGWILCFIHSWKHLGQWPTVSFFTGGFIFGIVRENIVSLLPSLYTYPDHPLYIGSAPLMMGFGWAVSFYACWMVTERLLEGFLPSRTNDRWLVPLITAILTGLLSIPVEVSAGAPQTLWWVWPSDAITVFYEMPALVPFGWAGAAFLFILFFRWISGRDMSDQKRFALFQIAALVIIVIHLVYVLAVRNIIVLILG